MKNAVKTILSRTCVINTVLIAFIYIIGYIVNYDESSNWIPKFSVMWMILGISFVLSLAEQVLKLKGNFTLRLMLHFALCVAGFLLVFIVVGGYGDSGSAVIIGTCLFIAAYILVNGVRFAVLSKFGKKENEGTEYTPTFKK